ncbi:MAG: hypothetical protein IKJ65_05375 [Clostridia bacterium]|nr:hypothetical protein [Clostridia bacterium]
MKSFTRVMTMILAIVTLVSSIQAFASEDGNFTNYTYNYDYWQDEIEMPDAYRVEQVVYSGTLGLETPMNKPQSLYIRGNRVYVADTGNNRVLEIERQGNQFKLLQIIDKIKGAQPETLSSPSDMFVDEAGNIYIADTNNQRIIKADKDLNFVMSFVKPTDPTFGEGDFLPARMVVDVSGRVYALATNINKGLIKYEADGIFAGFIGANPVTYTMFEYIWKTFFTSKAQRAQQAAFVPTEYSNIAIDEEGFIYATNAVFSEYDLLWDNAKPIRRLNSIGNDILVKNGWLPPIGDIYWEEQSIEHGPSKFKDITVLENDIYVAFDRTRGRLFGYDSQGILLWAFGNKGNTEGTFNGAVSIEHMGNDLYCLDELGCTITVFRPTDYGNLIFEASDQYLKGDYDASADTWREVLKLNANYNLAFIGIGRALMRQENFEEAMKYFRMAYDQENYGRAYRYFRKERIEENIGWIVAIAVVLIAVILILRVIRKMKWEVQEYESKRKAR